jgi:hypothetical protein
MTPDLNIFLQIWTGGCDASEAEAPRILNRLREDDDFRAECVAEIRLLGLCRTAQSSTPRWLDLAEALGIDGEPLKPDSDDFALGVMEQVTEETRRQGHQPWLSRLRWRPLAAAAAGLVFGIFSASMVWAIAWPGSVNKTREVLMEGFESPVEKFESKFPETTGTWSGNGAAIAGSKTAADGRFVLRFEPKEERRLSHINHLVDVSSLPKPVGGERRELHLVVMARSVEEVASTHRYTLRLAAFAEEPADVREQWFSGEYLSENALSMASRAVMASRHGWVALEAILPLPAESKNVVISVGVSSSDEARANVWYEVDALRLELITSQDVRP